MNLRNIMDTQKVNLKVDGRPKSEFEGSSLHNELKDLKNVPWFYHHTKFAQEKDPESKFWKDAWAFIQKQMKKREKLNI